MAAATLAAALAAQGAASLDAADPASRIAALERLAAAGPSGAGEAPAIAARLCDEHHGVRRAAVGALLSVRPEFASVRERLLGAVTAAPAKPTPEWSESGVFGVHRWSSCAAPVSLDALRAALDSTDPGVRRNAVSSLCWRGDEARDHREAVLALARDRDADVRAEVAAGAAAFGWTPAVREALGALLKDEIALVRASAASTLPHGCDDPLAIASLRAALPDPDPTVRLAIVQALGKCGAAGRPAAGEVTSMLRDRAPEVRLAALQALANLRPDGDRSAAMVVRCLDDEAADVRMAALRTLAALGPAAAAGFDRVLAITHDVRGATRRAALDASLRIAAPRDHGRLALRIVEALRDPNVAVQLHADACLRAFCAGTPHVRPR